MSPILAMHMDNILLSVPVAVATLALGAIVIAAAAWAARRNTDLDRLPLMGVMGAFVFAAQMVNFSLPFMPGTSGHLVGAVLLAILLRPAAAILTMAAILIVQCLLFQDGGLLALGCNIINMGVVPCLAGWGVYRLILGRRSAPPAWRQYLAAWAACLLGVTAGATLVPLEAGLSGVLKISPWDFLAVMTGVHLIIGFIEGAITFAVLGYLRKVRPEMLGIPAPSTGAEAPGGGARPGMAAVIVTILVTAGLLAGVVSWFASAHPDGLEWAIGEHKYAGVERAVENPSPVVAAVDEGHAKLVPMKDYNKPEGDGGGPKISGWASLAGLIGTAVVLVLLYGTAVLLRRRRKTHEAHPGCP